MSTNIPVICIVAGQSGTGKTTFMEKLIAELTSRGYEVAAVKSDTHGFEMDQPGKDTWRFAQAGSKITAIIGPNQFAMIQKTETKKSLDDILSFISGVDLVLVEGYKASDKPRIEVIREERSTQMVSSPDQLVAVVTDLKNLAVSVPVYDINDFAGTADLIVEKYLVDA